MVVVFDANVLIPVAIAASRSSLLVEKLRSQGHEIAASYFTVDEVREKMLGKPSLRKWLRLSDEDIRHFLEDLPSFCRVLPGAIQVTGVSPDPDDDYVLAAARECDAKFIVSEDRHLLDLGEWQGIRIVDRATMLQVLDMPETST